MDKFTEQISNPNFITIQIYRPFNIHSYSMYIWINLIFILLAVSHLHHTQLALTLNRLQPLIKAEVSCQEVWKRRNPWLANSTRKPSQAYCTPLRNCLRHYTQKCFASDLSMSGTDQQDKAICHSTISHSSKSATYVQYIAASISWLLTQTVYTWKR